MFEGMVYTIDRVNHQFILDTKDNQICQLQKEINQKGGINVLTQEEWSDRFGEG